MSISGVRGPRQLVCSPYASAISASGFTTIGFLRGVANARGVLFRFFLNVGGGGDRIISAVRIRPSWDGYVDAFKSGWYAYGHAVGANAPFVSPISNQAPPLAANLTSACNFTAGLPFITRTAPGFITGGLGIRVGMPVSGTGIAAGSIVEEILDNSTIRLSKACELSGSSVTLTFAASGFAPTGSPGWWVAMPYDHVLPFDNLAVVLETGAGGTTDLTGLWCEAWPIFYGGSVATALHEGW